MRQSIKQQFKHYAAIAYLLVAATLLTPLLLAVNPETANADTPYEATSVLGQTNPVTGEPLFTTGAVYDQNASQYGLNGASGMTLDAVNHRLFSADLSNDRVLVYNLDTNNNLIDNIPDYVLGQADFFGSSAATTASGLDFPRSVAFDAVNNRLFVADGQNNRVVVYDTAAITNGESAINVLGQPDFTTATADTNAKGFRNPLGLAYDSANSRLFVADGSSANRVLVFDVAAITDNEDAVNVLGQANFTTGTSDLNAKGFNNPNGLAYDSATSRLFVSDSTNRRVLVFDVATIVNNEDAVNVLGQANFTTGTSDLNAQGFNNPSGLAYDPATSRLFVADSSNNRVLVFDVATIVNNEDAVNVLGQANFTTGTSDLNAQGFNSPGGVAFITGANKLFVGDSNRIMVFDVASITDNEDAVNVLGQTTTLTGSTLSYTTNNTNNVPWIVSTGMYGSEGIAIDTVHHRLFVSDTWASRILVYNLDSNNNLVDVYPDFVLMKADFATFDYGGVSATTGCSEGMAYDAANDRLFVADPCGRRVLVFDTTTIVNGEAAVNVLGQPDFTSSGSDTNAQGFSDPNGLAYDSATSRLFVTDSSNHRVLIFDVASITNNQDAINVLGQPDFTSSGFDTNAKGFRNPRHLDYDATNKRLFVTDSQNNRVLVFDLTTAVDNEDAVNVLGQTDFTSGGFATTANRLSGGAGVAYDDVADRLFVNDEYNNRTLVFDVASITDGEAATGVLGQSDFTSALEPPTPSASNFEGTQAIAFDSGSRQLFVFDQYRFRTLGFSFANLTDQALDTAALNSSYTEQAPFTGTQGTETFTITSGSLPTGVTLNSSTGALSGTPSVLGTYNFTVELSDDNGVAGVFTDTQSYSITVSVNADTDGDGSLNSVEDSAPNSGDANDDGTQDSTQDNVISIVNSVTSEYTVLETGGNCSITETDVIPESSNSAADNDYDYPLGLMNFIIDCGTPLAATSIKQYYYNTQNTPSVARKYNPNSTTYFNLGNATTTQATIDGSNVTVLSYNVTDNGELDTDNLANGIIVDPAGLASPTNGTSLVNTGENRSVYLVNIIGLVLIGSTFVVLMHRRNRAVYRLISYSRGARR